MIPHVNKGDRITASHTNKMVDGINEQFGAFGGVTHVGGFGKAQANARTHVRLFKLTSAWSREEGDKAISATGIPVEWGTASQIWLPFENSREVRIYHQRWPSYERPEIVETAALVPPPFTMGDWVYCILDASSGKWVVLSEHETILRFQLAEDLGEATSSTVPTNAAAYLVTWNGSSWTTHTNIGITVINFRSGFSGNAGDRGYCKKFGDTYGSLAFEDIGGSSSSNYTGSGGAYEVLDLGRGAEEGESEPDHIHGRVVSPSIPARGSGTTTLGSGVIRRYAITGSIATIWQPTNFYVEVVNFYQEAVDFGQAVHALRDAPSGRYFLAGADCDSTSLPPLSSSSGG